MSHHTPLFDWHRQAGAQMVDFAGWQMPMHYGSQIAEHHAVRQAAGIFDVSHMGVVDIKGNSAGDFLRYVLANDIQKLKNDGNALYSCMLNENGGVIDDLIAYRISPDFYRLIINAARREIDLKWLQQLSSSYAVEIKLRDDLSLLAVQGPKAIAIAEKIFSQDATAIAQLKSFQALITDTLMLARTGYTGEDGLEICLPQTMALKTWQEFIKHGAAPCGLGARDTLRLEAGLNLYGIDMDETTSPLVSNLAWTISWQDATRQFVGRNALEMQKQQGIPQKLIGIIMEQPGVLRNHQRLFIDGDGEGMITSGGYSPTLGYAIALARIPFDVNTTTAKIDRRGERIPVKITQPPFIRKGKK